MSASMDWGRVERIFHEVAAAPPARRAALLEHLCEGDDGLREEVASLLKAGDAPDFLERSIVDRLEDRMLGSLVGSYRIEERIGEGAMGVVYRASRADEAYEGDVVVKLIRAALIDADLLRRFRRERQILASLDHPNIARLIDAGVTNDDRPYLITDFVHGTPITDFAEAHGLSVDERLDLFDQVCAGVQHAHANLIVHRDLKPAHILVDDDLRPRLLDFGIAGVLDEMSNPVETIEDVRRFTPQYASPEQIAGAPITTATDIYALGLILYELLAGEPPYRVTDATSDADRRRICETMPPTPSRSAERANGHRRSRRLRGDLDTIVMTSIHKDADRRYRSVEALREDIRRHRADLPIHARPDDWRYRTKKFVSRNRVPVGAALVVLLALVGGVIATSWQAHVAQRHADVAERALAASERVQRFLRSILTAADPREGGQAMTMREALDVGAARIDAELGDEPGVEALVRQAIGATYRTLGAHEPAELHLVRAHALAAEAFSRDDPARASIAHEIAILRYDQGRFQEAEQLARVSLADRDRLLGSAHNDTLESENVLALILEQQGQQEEALAHLEHVVEQRERLLGPDHPSTLEARNNHANILTSLGRYEESLSLMQGIYEGQVATLGENHPDTLITANDMGTILGRLERWEEALPWQRRALAGLERQYPPGSIDVAIPRLNIARSLARTGHDEEAVRLQSDAIKDALPALGDSHYVVAVLRMDRGTSLIRLERPEEARADLEAAHPALLEAFGPDHAFTRQAATALQSLDAGG